MYSKKSIIGFCFMFLSVSTSYPQIENQDKKLIHEIEITAKKNILEKWYPLVVDYEDGGFYSTVTANFELGKEHDKMIVTQARHLWTTSRAAQFFPKDTLYLSYAKHGFKFLKNEMWDEQNGGFYNLVNKKGEPIPKKGEEKTAYGNAFAIYGLSTYYQASGNQKALELAIKTFYWLEENSHDPKNKGYFQSLELDGTPFVRDKSYPSTSVVGYKDQNSSIHLLEAFSELYKVWPNELLKKRTKELLILIRDTITTEKGYMNLFFEPDWTPVSFKNTSKEKIKEHYYIDHVSFGHDVETAYLLLEASHVLGLNNSLTLKKAKKMVDHALKTGWDEEVGGFYDGGYYFKNKEDITIVNDHKNWWSQAEVLNTLLLMSHYFPNNEIEYRTYFDKLWDYTQTYVIDYERGGWYEWGLDKTPGAIDDLKGHIWKATYHAYRALTNLMLQLKEDNIAPSEPTNLVLENNILSWGKAEDNNILLGYAIFLNGKKIGFTPLNTFEVESLPINGIFQVSAVDLHGNTSKKIQFHK